MALSYKLETLEGLSEEVAKLYVKQDDGTFLLDVDTTTIKKESGGDGIPKHRFDEVNEQKKGLEKDLEKIAETHMEAVPEEFRDIIPKSLSPMDKITFIQNAQKKNLFTKKSSKSPDSKAPGSGNSDFDPDKSNPLSMIEIGLTDKKK
jgi:hypothetical protein